MSHHEDNLAEDVDGVLHSSLSTAFTPISLSSSNSGVLVNGADARPGTPPPTHHHHYAFFSHQYDAPRSPPPAEPVSREEIENWQAEQEVQLAAWREENARARQKAEDVRARWEALREEERKRGDLGAREGEAGWGPPSVLFPDTLGRPKGYPGESSVADARDQVGGEPSKGSGSHATGHADDDVDPLAQSTQSSSHKWEEIPSDAAMESSYPSLSFPSHSRTPSPSPPGQGKHKERHHDEHTRHHNEKHGTGKAHGREYARQPPLTSPTLALFTTPSSKTRLAALASSLAINLLLPFINGVMLGLGEIVARGLVAKFGWVGWGIAGRGASIDATERRRPGGAATAVGLNSTR